jgi:hypothetical protein
MQPEPVEAVTEDPGIPAPAKERCPVTAPGSGAQCELEAGHEGARHRVPMSPTEMLYRQEVSVLHAHRDQTERAKLMPVRDAKMNAVLDRQAVIMDALALLLDFALQSQGLYPAVLPKAGDGGA